MKNQAIAEAFHVLKQNLIVMAEENDALFKVMDFAAWTDTVKRRSEIIRNIFEENERSIAFLQELSETRLTRELADDLLEGLRDMKKEEMHDPTIMIRMMKRLLPFYEAEKDYDCMVYLYLNIAYEEMEFFLRMDPKTYREEVKGYLLKAIALKPYYNQIRESENRQRIFMAYYNIISALPDLIPEYRKDILTYYKDAIAFFHSAPVQRIDKDNEDIENEIFYLKDVIISVFTLYMSELSDQQKEYCMLLHDLLSESDEAENDYPIAFIALAQMEGRISFSEMVNRILNCYHEMLDSFCDDNSEKAFMDYCNIQDTAHNLIELMPLSEMTETEKSNQINEIIVPIKDFLFNTSFADRPTYYDEILSDMCKVLLPYGRNIEEKEELLMKLIIRRQPITYIHCLMVEQIVKLITRALLESDNPVKDQLLSEQFDTKEEALEFLCRCARLHDIGKCRIAGVINLQARKLMDEEFAYIKLHPEKALEYIGSDEDFRPYLDIILGHHKTFDGKGYPYSFDNTLSSRKICIDIISIADSIDAATDILGRNYTKGKDFAHVLKELISQSGYRYNGAIVSIIAQNPRLCQDLTALTGEGRIAIYYHAYQMLTNGHVNRDVSV